MNTTRSGYKSQAVKTISPGKDPTLHRERKMALSLCITLTHLTLKKKTPQYIEMSPYRFFLIMQQTRAKRVNTFFSYHPGKMETVAK